VILTKHAFLALALKSAIRASLPLLRPCIPIKFYYYYVNVLSQSTENWSLPKICYSHVLENLFGINRRIIQVLIARN
jgi:hypothetical protein